MSAGWITRRTAIGLAAVAACAIGLGWRVHEIRDTPRIEVAPRVTELTYIRLLSQWVDDYARRYGRPAFSLDSVEAHLDTGDLRAVRNLRTSIYGGFVGYGWDYCGFSLHASTGIPRPRPTKTAGVAAHPPSSPFDLGPSQISEVYPWPPGVGRTTDCTTVE